MLDFNNTEVAFANKSNYDLKNAFVLFKTIQSSGMVKTAKVLSDFALKIHFPVSWAVKPTLYRQFVGGETLKDCSKTMDNLSHYGVKSVLDYSAEGGTELRDVQNAYEETIRSIEFAANNRNVAYSVFKPTAMIMGSVLYKASESMSSLSDIEKAEYQNFRDRFFALCQKAYDANIRILVDAEHYTTQGIIDSITEEAMRKFNGKRAIVFHTLQMYRKDRLEYLKYIHNDSKVNSYVPGIKFVRGAYMEEERDLAKERGYSSPIHETKADTDKCYDDGLRYVVSNIDDFELFSGTHNYESNYLLAELIRDRGITNGDQRIFFSQLYGMSDNITFALANDGYNVCKYVPYAPVKKVLPYLMRRAEENTSMEGQTGRELNLIKIEMERRKQLKKSST